MKNPGSKREMSSCRLTASLRQDGPSDHRNLHTQWTHVCVDELCSEPRICVRLPQLTMLPQHSPFPPRQTPTQEGGVTTSFRMSQAQGPMAIGKISVTSV